MYIFIMSLGFVILFIDSLYPVTSLYSGIQESYVNKNGRQCQSASDCGPNVRCENGFCACGINGQALTFDTILGTCATLAGSSCSDDYQCVSNSNCDTVTNKCTCDSTKFSQTSFGECRLNYGKDCNQAGIYCNAEKFMNCNVEWVVCTCANDEEQIYDSVSGGCLARPIERCEIMTYGMYPPCVNHATCVSNTETFSGFGICICAEGFEASDHSYCLPLYGSSCNTTNGCATDKNLQCSVETGYCTCKSGSIWNESIRQCLEVLTCPIDSIWDPTLSRCRIKASSLCADNDVCVQNAVCEDGLCECTTNYLPAKEGYCQHQSASSKALGCDTANLADCNRDIAGEFSSDLKNCSNIFQECAEYCRIFTETTDCVELTKVSKIQDDDTVVVEGPKRRHISTNSSCSGDRNVVPSFCILLLLELVSKTMLLTYSS